MWQLEETLKIRPPYTYSLSLFGSVSITQSCPTLFNPMGCSLPGSSVCWILQARILEWVAIPFSRGSSQPRDWTQVSHIAGRFFTYEPPGKPLYLEIEIQIGAVFQYHSPKSSHPRPLPQSPKDCSIHLCLFAVSHTGLLLPSLKADAQLWTARLLSALHCES